MRAVQPAIYASNGQPILPADLRAAFSPGVLIRATIKVGAWAMSKADTLVSNPGSWFSFPRPHLLPEAVYQGRGDHHLVSI
jgi:hypothetical protein